MDINKAFPILLTFEGKEFTNATFDKGGATKFGISEVSNPDLDVKNLTEDQAKVIYQNRYWIPAHCEDAPNQLKYVLFDTAINDGVKEAIKTLQHSATITVDGIWGNQTQIASQNVSAYSYLTWRQWVYSQIVLNDPTQEKWLEGWNNRVNRLKEMLQNNQLA